MAEEHGENFILPAPKFKDETKKSLDNFNRHLNPHFSSPSGMLLPSDKQPPLMYGPRGSTVPPQYMFSSRTRPGPPAFQPIGQHYRPFHQNTQNNKRPPSRQGGRCQNYRGHRPNEGQPNNGLEKEVNPSLLLLDWRLWCEGCDVNCRSEEEYQNHLDNHMPCSVSGCKFIGHPMIMKKHMRQVHKSEECDKKGDQGPSREEIEQWKEERRKRYPTKNNVMLRQQAQEERLKRGERIEQSKERFSNRHVGNFPPRENTERKNTFNSQPPKRSKRRRRTRGSVKAPAAEESTGRTLFVGTSLLQNYKEPTKNALGMLAEYGTDSNNTSDEDEIVEVELTAEKEPPSQALERNNAPSEAENCGSGVKPLVCASPEDVNAKSSEREIIADGVNADYAKAEKDTMLGKNSNIMNSLVAMEVECRIISKSRPHKPREKYIPKAGEIRQDRKSFLDYSKLRRSNQNTMLEKLLDPDIRHERNVLLQCVRHVLLNEFFGIGKTKEIAASTY